MRGLGAWIVIMRGARVLEAWIGPMRGVWVQRRKWATKERRARIGLDHASQFPQDTRLEEN